MTLEILGHCGLEVQLRETGELLVTKHATNKPGTVSQNLKSRMNEGQRLNYILDRSLYDSKMIEGEKSIFYRPVF